MQIVGIKIKNYRSLQNIELKNLPAFCVFVGANGTGKSTLFDVFGFLRDALTNNIRQALQIRGGFQEVVTRGHENEDIEFEIKFNTKILEKERTVTYILIISQEGTFPIIEKEILRYRRGNRGKPFHFLEFSNGQGFAITNEEDFDKTEQELKREEQVLDSPDILAIKGLGQFQRFKAASAFRLLIENWHVSYFEINASRRSKDVGYAEHLSTTGDNLPLVAQYLSEKYPDIFNKILEIMKKRVPGISKVEAKTTEDGRLILKFQEQAFKDPFIARDVSDGTIKMFAYLVLLYDPNPHPLLCIEEPENHLYPLILMKLAEEFKAYCLPKNQSSGQQVLVSTHSPDFLNGVDLDDVFWLEKKEGITKIYRANDDDILKELFEAGDLPGALWKQGLFGSANP